MFTENKKLWKMKINADEQYVLFFLIRSMKRNYRNRYDDNDFFLMTEVVDTNAIKLGTLIDIG